MTRITTTPSSQSSSSPKAISLKSPVKGWTRHITEFITKASNGRTVGQFDKQPCSGTGRCADTQTLPRHNGQLEKGLSNTKSPTPVPHSSFEELRETKGGFLKKQSRSVGAINSVNAGYSSVGQQTKPNRFISSDKGGRIDNQTSVVSTVSTDIRGHNQARTRYQGFDKDSTQLRE